MQVKFKQLSCWHPMERRRLLAEREIPAGIGHQSLKFLKIEIMAPKIAS